MNKEKGSISVVIPVKNEAAKIRACIEGILSQTVPVKEIIAIDSGSSDKTVEILQQYDKVRVIEIPPNEFNHGLTRNLGVSEAVGDFVLLTVGDARPFNQFWIEELLKGFTDEAVAGVCGQQVVPHEKDKNPMEWFRPVSSPEIKRYQFKSLPEFQRLPPLQKRTICGWDDVTAMYRREILARIPFKKTSYSEDAIWARDALEAGYAIVYNTAAKVYHYHLEDKDFAFKRGLTTLYFRYKYFGYIQEPRPLDPVYFMRVLKHIGLQKELSLGEKIKWIRYNYELYLSSRKAIRFFNESLKVSEQFLDEVHDKWCGKPPIPLKSPAK